MGKTGKAQQGSGSEPTGGKHSGVGAGCAPHAGNDDAHCGLCALLRRNGTTGPPRTASTAAHGLRIALVADGVETLLTARG